MDQPSSSIIDTRSQLYWIPDRPQSKFELHSDNFLELLLAKQRKEKLSQFQHQIEAALKIREYFLKNEDCQKNDGEFAGTKPAVIVTPTGSDTTGIVFMLPYVLKSHNVLILAPSKVVGDEICKAFGRRSHETCFFDTLGVFSSCKLTRERQVEHFIEYVNVLSDPTQAKDRFSNLVVLNAQRFGGRSKFSLYYKRNEIVRDSVAFFQKFDTIIVDEAHHYPAKTWFQITEACQKGTSERSKKIIFLTAAPQHSVDTQMKFIFGNKSEVKVRIVHTLPQILAFGSACRSREFLQPSHDGQAVNVFMDLQKILAKSAQREPRFAPQALVLVKFKKEVKELAESLNRESGHSNFAVGMLDDKSDFEAFSNGDYQVGIVRIVCAELQENRNIVACVVLRKIVHGKLLFAQFVRCCLSMKWGLEGSVPDQSIGYVLSYPEFEQKKMFDEIDKMAEEDPLEVNERLN